jgi:hypothetical protein
MVLRLFSIGILAIGSIGRVLTDNNMSNMR